VTEGDENDPVAEVEARVEAIILDHRVAWGCDDPVCAVMSSTFMQHPHQPKSKPWWKRLFRRK
jgi:hypothetical protein